MFEAVPIFWCALGSQQLWFTEPRLVLPDDPDDGVYMIQTHPGFIFDDAFWEKFQGFPFKVCHVAYYGPERLEAGDRRQDIGIFELRFVSDGKVGT